ncbi:hypothetical protein HYV30_00250 [Candidatus Kaiserbacteria bacterium]|nr:hypothetical protein [Candidatus Kaiserbacteria bacterium]
MTESNPQTINDSIVTRVKVDHSRSSQEALAATGREQYVDDVVVTEMPRGGGREVEVCFFELDHWVNDIELEKEYVRRGLAPVDPFSLAAVNEAYPLFADGHPNATHWQDANGRWCYAKFGRPLSGARHVLVYLQREGCVYSSGWFAGRRK